MKLEVNFRFQSSSDMLTYLCEWFKFGQETNTKNGKYK